MAPSLRAFLNSISFAVFIIIVPISLALVFVSSSDRVIRN